LTNYVPLSGQQFEAGLATRMHALTPHFGPGHTRFPAELQMYSELQYQATDWAFVDVFRWLALLCLVGAVLVWFFKRVERGRPAAGAH
jgi:DHA2 family multidrug resistance protein